MSASHCENARIDSFMEDIAQALVSPVIKSPAVTTIIPPAVTPIPPTLVVSVRSAAIALPAAVAKAKLIEVAAQLPVIVPDFSPVLEDFLSTLPNLVA
jgi:hypothetical protein